jgi:hypothetical protein
MAMPTQVEQLSGDDRKKAEATLATATDREKLQEQAQAKNSKAIESEKKLDDIKQGRTQASYDEIKQLVRDVNPDLNDVEFSKKLFSKIHEMSVNGEASEMGFKLVRLEKLVEQGLDPETAARIAYKTRNPPFGDGLGVMQSFTTEQFEQLVSGLEQVAENDASKFKFVSTSASTFFDAGGAAGILKACEAYDEYNALNPEFTFDPNNPESAKKLTAFASHSISTEIAYIRNDEQGTRIASADLSFAPGGTGTSDTAEDR